MAVISGAFILAPWGTISVPWGHLGRPWEQQEGHMGSGVKMVVILTRVGDPFCQLFGTRFEIRFFCRACFHAAVRVDF